MRPTLSDVLIPALATIAVAMITTWGTIQAAGGKLQAAERSSNATDSAIAVLKTQVDSARLQVRLLQDSVRVANASIEESRKDKPIAPRPSRPVAVATRVDQLNDGDSAVLVTGYCNATVKSKDLTAKIRGPGGSWVTIVSESGPNRLSITFLVPAQWSYQITWTNVDGVNCAFRGWSL